MKAGWMTMPLAFVVTFAFLFVVGTSGAGLDGNSDTDTHQDNIDNCSNKPNEGQEDTDQDGHGNACDGDFTQDGIVGGPDFAAFAGAFLATENGAGWNADVDCNGDGIIGGPDFACFAGQFGQGFPGPSGRACAPAAGQPNYPKNGSAPTGRKSVGKPCPDPTIRFLPRAAALP